MTSEHSESQETNSTSLVEDSLNISFENINYTVRDGLLFRGRKTILDNMCGSFNSGELTIIVGQSGAGKSTLMDILSGYTKPTNGCILINGRVRNINKFRRRSCYILQDDRVQDMLTIEEALNIAADLKLGDHVSYEQRKRRVEEIITSLGLNSSRHTKGMHLSGGQKKRLAIGQELVNDPPVLFLDEPTSGLDSSISKQIVYLLHLLARQGRTVIATMHQPSSAHLHMVDKLYAIVSGKCAYFGSVPQLLPFLEQMELTCPPYHNPVDFLIEICVDNTTQLVRNSRNGRNMNWLANICQETEDNILKKNFNIGDDVCLTSLPTPKEDPTSKILLALKSTYSTSHWKQFSTLTQRSFLTIWRDPGHTRMVVGIHFAMAFFISVLYYNIGDDAKYARDIYNYLYYSLMFLMFTAYSTVAIKFPEQIPVIRREHFNRWYTAGAYYVSTFVSVLPTQTICTLSYATVTYWLTGQPLEFDRFAIFCVVLLMVSYVALCKGLLIGSLFNVKHGVIFGPFFIMPFTIFSGFFLRYADAPFFMRWLFQLSFLKHGLVGLLLAIFGMDRPNLSCSDIYCHYKYPSQFLLDNGVVGEKYYVLVLALLSIGTLATTLSFFILNIRLKHKW